ncbi:MAG: PKD domain-containing protein [Bacteroidetes bacterium]|nr:PKD domain-containing protein [Bacteroidota bacterium]
MKKHLLLICFIAASFTTLAQSPVANFNTTTPSSGCSPITVSFQDASSGNPTSWLWDFGNGNTSTQQNPSAQYSTPGSYTVKLRVTNAQGTDSITKVNYVRVFANPSASFTALPNVICQGGTIAFTDSTVIGSAPIETWFWSFGDGDTLTTTTGNTIHTYNAALSGSFSVTPGGYRY